MPRSHSHGHSIRSIGKRSPIWNAKLHRREVPQEHSHEIFLTIVNEFLRKDNPDNIQDAVFGLLGNAAGQAGQGKITDTDCLQQATADRAFTNAKNEDDLDGMIASLIYRALERNTGAVGQESVLCTSIQAVNPEIAAISQHQDPASDGAAATNKAIALELAVQIALIGGDPLDALDSGTFAPGEIGDPTGAGNTCDDLDDTQGCIFTQNLIVEDATEDEVKAFVASRTAGGATPPAATGGAAATECPVTTTGAAEPAKTTLATVTKPADTKATSSAAPPPATTTAPPSPGNKLDIGTCSNAKVIFAANLDGRKEAMAFEPANKTDFPHGSAENIKIITDFICQQLNTKCKAPKATIDACTAAAGLAGAATGQAAADAFNSAFGN
ncbi:uncharacterized protein A1O9_03986 [Exophiala aquamarina CBS 119918]|uniref:Uncharacterized protein n=1 Tax=Exophiala aquamarina CBS 119918 TaxID=1182545 RepID=A0A072PHB4_9EURO|nr:uncharacterized protein A1O9_03986 [Exophiala aquamarina CBS 119918]KEF59142.1 hypothetical protein A1O9_03986 [Exophiala aquamarina CBS 119918]